MNKQRKTVRIYAPGEDSTQYNAYLIAKNRVEHRYSKEYSINFDERRITEVVNSRATEDDHIEWLTGGKDEHVVGCGILCHPFQANYPPDWDYGYFLRKLKETATKKGIAIFPETEHLEDDAAFSQV
jgi:hypothetical protein